MTLERTCEIVPIETVVAPQGDARPAVSHESALWLWRQGWSPLRRLDADESRSALAVAMRNDGIRWLREVTGHPSESPIHILCGAQEVRRRLKRAMCHVVPTACDGPIPLVEARSPRGDATVTAVAPEVSWAQVAMRAGATVARELAWELTGTFRPDKAAPFGLDGRAPLATVADLMDAAVLLRGGRYPKHIGRMLLGVCDRTASPMEGRVACLMTLPRRSGGHGLPMPVVNAPLELTPEERLLVGSSIVVPDFYWQDAGLVVEYDSSAAHGDGRSAAHDAHKRNVYAARGITSLALMRDQLMDPAACDAFMDVVRRHLDMDPETPRPGVRRSRARLRRELLGWRASEPTAEGVD